MKQCAWLLVLAIVAAGCGGSVSSTDADAGIDGATPPTGEGGARLYARLCASCHGESGEGGLGPRLIDWSRSVGELASIIDERMPQGSPESCDHACSVTLASYIVATFTSEALRCDSIPPSPRRLRLLDRREYAASVRDLLRLPSPDPGGGSPSECRTRTFTFDPAGRSLGSVAVAGSFNGWSPSAWPMRRDEGTGRWTLTRELPDGDHQYKFVLDGSEWVRDPGNPETASDGFGGLNSVLRVSCGGTSTGTVFDPAEGLPADARSEGFLFDTDADAMVVTDVHVTEYLRAARRAAAEADVPALLGCDPRSDARGCAESFVRSFGRRALRRSLGEAEVARYRDLVLAQADFMTGAETAIAAFLMSPHFLYRSEMGAPVGDGTYRLTADERASALAYQLWGSTPDEALLDAAASGALDTPEGLEAQARRLLADPRARAPMGAFALSWLGVESADSLTKQASMFPRWSQAAASAMREEARLFVTRAVFDGSHGLDELFTGRTSFVNEDLAPIYGLSGITGSELREAEVPADRAGVLSLPAVLATYAHSDQTSPIRRGLLVRRNLLCQSFPPPPADAGGVPDVDPDATTRERFAQHTANPRCASCHQYIDDIGFGFERFDAIGAPRDSELGRPIDSRGDMNDVEGLGSGTHAAFDTLPELGAILAESEAAEECFVRQYYRFSRGYRETAEDRCAIQALTSRMRAHGDIRELMIDVVLSPEWAVRRDVGGGL